MENKKPKTIDEFFIEKYEKLEEVNKELMLKLEEKQRTIDEYQQTYEETYNLIEEIKKDLHISLEESNDDAMPYISFTSNCIWNGFGQEEKFAYYKQAFNLKEEGK